jgi:hypothetical protein
MATAPYMLRSIDKQPIFSLRDEIKKRTKLRRLEEENLAPFAEDTRALYLDLIHALLNNKPVLTNTDGDLLAPQTLHFEISSPSAAVSQLMKLTRNVLSEKQILEDAVFEVGQLKEVEIPWFKRGKNSNEESGYTVLGRIRINGTKLSVHVNSARRAKKIKDKIEKLLGTDVAYRTTVLESIEKHMECANEGSDSRDGELEAPVSLQVQERLKAVADAHWKRWMDEPIPALNGFTPREASKNKTGRDLLNSLLLYYEQQDRKSPHNSFSPNLKALRDELGI